MAQWEYLTVLVSQEMLDYEALHPKSVNGQELKNWKQIDLSTLFDNLDRFDLRHHYFPSGYASREPPSTTTRLPVM